MRVVISTAAIFLAATLPVRAFESYDSCIAAVQADPVAAERAAGEWARFGGGAGARHCYAQALIAIGAPIAAADELIGLAQEEPGLDDATRADVLVQAGELLLEGGSPLTAMVVAEQAIRLSNAGPAALGLRAAVHLAEGRPVPALADLDQALRGGPDALLLLRRAAAHRRLGNGVAARDDASWATELAPGRAAAWLERGRADALLGDKPAARRALMRAIELDRDGTTGRTAQLALQRMEAGVTD